MLTIDVANTMTIALKKAEKDLAVEVAKMPQVSLAHVFEYGLRQILNDAMASEPKPAEALALAEKRLANLMEGKLRATSTREGDPIKRETRRIAEERVTVAIKKQGRKPKEVANFAQLVKDVMAREDVQAQARANVAAIADLDIELDLDLGADPADAEEPVE